MRCLFCLFEATLSYKIHSACQRACARLQAPACAQSTPQAPAKDVVNALQSQLPSRTRAMCHSSRSSAMRSCRHRAPSGLALARADDVHGVGARAEVGAERAAGRAGRDVGGGRRRPAARHREVEVGPHDPHVVRVARARPDGDGCAARAGSGCSAALPRRGDAVRRFAGQRRAAVGGSFDAEHPARPQRWSERKAAWRRSWDGRAGRTLGGEAAVGEAHYCQAAGLQDPVHLLKHLRTPQCLFIGLRLTARPPSQAAQLGT